MAAAPRRHLCVAGSGWGRTGQVSAAARAGVPDLQHRAHESGGTNRGLGASAAAWSHRSGVKGNVSRWFSCRGKGGDRPEHSERSGQRVPAHAPSPLSLRRVPRRPLAPPHRAASPAQARKASPPSLPPGLNLQRGAPGAPLPGRDARTQGRGDDEEPLQVAIRSCSKASSGG